jgi:2-amino-4-hydroxy-6-hydroxymethyldihydropteridine diphosphokinase
VRRVRWGARTLDLDLLLLGDRVVREPGLTVPHPGIAERRFVLAPLAELRPELPVPGADASVGRLLEEAPELDLAPVGGYPL